MRSLPGLSGPELVWKAGKLPRNKIRRQLDVTHVQLLDGVILMNSMDHQRLRQSGKHLYTYL